MHQNCSNTGLKLVGYPQTRACCLIGLWRPCVWGQEGRLIPLHQQPRGEIGLPPCPLGLLYCAVHQTLGIKPKGACHQIPVILLSPLTQLTVAIAVKTYIKTRLFVQDRSSRLSQQNIKIFWLQSKHFATYQHICTSFIVFSMQLKYINLNFFQYIV